MRVAVVGTGHIAGRHAEALTGLGAEIVGHVSRAGPYRHVGDLPEDVDAVWICVPPGAHRDIEHALIERDVPFYVEKPVGTDVAGPRRVAAALRERGTLAGVGYYWRAMEVIPELRRLLAETPPRLVRAAWHGVLPGASWWRVQEQSGGQVVEQATHLFDLARFLLGEAEVRHAEVSHSPDLEVATVSTATLRFASGPIGVFTATCVLHTTVDAEIEFHCDGRKLTLTNKVLRREDAGGIHETPVGRDPLVIADERFLAAVSQGDPGQLVCDYEDAVRTQELCCGVRDLAESGDEGNGRSWAR